MKKINFYGLIILFSISIISSCKSVTTKVRKTKSPYEVVTYVWQEGNRMPDPFLQTTINYGFANMNDTRDGVIINNEPHFRSIVELKKINPELKVLLCIGGGANSGLSEMAADSLKRISLANQCKQIIEDYDIDGIDFDWEFPGVDGNPDDYDNFAIVLKTVRDSIGANKLLTLAAGGDMAGMDANNVELYLSIIDYVNVMAYDLSGSPETHHTSLYRSKYTGWRYVDEVVQDYLDHGVPYGRMMLGLGFYGRGDGVHYSEWTSSMSAMPYDDLTEQWDSVGLVPYIADVNGELTVGYENQRSIEIKCDYLKKRGFRGAMIWRTELDLDSLQLARTVARCLLNR